MVRRNALRFLVCLLLLPLLLALLAGCGGDSRGSADAEQPADSAQTGEKATGEGQAKEPAAPSNPKQSQKKGVTLKQVYSDEKTGLTVQTPIYWEATMKDDALAVFLSPQNGVEDLYRENVVITADDQFENLTLAAYLKALADEIRNRYPDTETLESGEVEIDSIMGHWMVDSFTGSKGPAKVYRVVLVREGVAYVFHGTAPTQTFDELYRPIFEAMARSIHWPKPEAEE